MVMLNTPTEILTLKKGDVISFTEKGKRYEVDTCFLSNSVLCLQYMNPKTGAYGSKVKRKGQFKTVFKHDQI